MPAVLKGKHNFKFYFDSDSSDADSDTSYSSVTRAWEEKALRYALEDNIQEMESCLLNSANERAVAKTLHDNGKVTNSDQALNLLIRCKNKNIRKNLAKEIFNLLPYATDYLEVLQKANHINRVMADYNLSEKQATALLHPEVRFLLLERNSLNKKYLIPADIINYLTTLLVPLTLNEVADMYNKVFTINCNHLLIHALKRYTNQTEVGLLFADMPKFKKFIHKRYPHQDRAKSIIAEAEKLQKELPSNRLRPALFSLVEKQHDLLTTKSSFSFFKNHLGHDKKPHEKLIVHTKKDDYYASIDRAYTRLRGL